jgi:hypothetical protein
MSKTQLTLKDLKLALAPLLEALASNSAQTTEMHAMITNMTTKIDLMDQSHQEGVPELKKAVPKKRVVKKKTDDAPVKKPVKLKPKKKGADGDGPEDAEDAEDSDDESDDESDAGSESKKKPVKQVKPCKKPTKKTVVKKTRLPNKWEFFNAKFDEDDTYFSAYITEDVITELTEANGDKWGDLTSEDSRKARRGVYYHYMKDNHDKKLKAMKEAYHEEITKQQPVIAVKEE